MMGIFGKLDATKINTNPYWVEAGEYTAVVRDAYVKTNESTGRTQLVIVYRITDEDSIYKDKPVQDWFDIFPDLDESDLENMSSDEQRIVDRALTALKRRLCGQANTNRKGLGVPEEDLNDDNWDPKSLIDKEVNLAIVNSGPDNEYTNIRWVNLAD